MRASAHERDEERRRYQEQKRKASDPEICRSAKIPWRAQDKVAKEYKENQNGLFRRQRKTS
jgi:hypothetical protein